MSDEVDIVSETTDVNGKIVEVEISVTRDDGTVEIYTVATRGQ